MLMVITRHSELVPRAASRPSERQRGASWARAVLTQRRDHIGKDGRRGEALGHRAGLRSPCAQLETWVITSHEPARANSVSLIPRADSVSSLLRSALPRLSAVGSANAFRSRRVRLKHR